jgi:hypothetical protein
MLITQELADVTPEDELDAMDALSSRQPDSGAPELIAERLHDLHSGQAPRSARAQRAAAALWRGGCG